MTTLQFRPGTNEKRSEPPMEGRKSAHWLVIERWVKDNGWTAGAELGLQRGWTICHLLKTCPELHMIGVDIWMEPKPTGEPGWQSYDHIDLDYWAEVCKKRVAEFDGRGTIHHMTTTEAAALVEDESLDFVFIDADHTERGKTEDILTWAPKVKRTGWITGHDWNRPEVAAVLDRLLPGWHSESDFCWWIPKAETAL